MINDKIPIAKNIKETYMFIEKSRYKLWSILSDLQAIDTIDAPDWKDELIGSSKAEIINGDILKIFIPEYFPRFKELIEKNYKLMWLLLIQNALKQLNAIPNYKNAFVFIEINSTHTKQDWDVDNRAISLIINALKGIVYENDDYENLSFAVKGKKLRKKDLINGKPYTNIYIMDFNKYIKPSLFFI